MTDGDAFTAALVDDVANGVLGLNVDGSFTYRPHPNFNGEDPSPTWPTTAPADSNPPP